MRGVVHGSISYSFDRVTLDVELMIPVRPKTVASPILLSYLEKISEDASRLWAELSNGGFPLPDPTSPRRSE